MTKEELQEIIDEHDNYVCEACGGEIDNYFERYCENCKLEINNFK